MPQLTSIVPTTELDAVNQMLAAIGEAPITNVDTATQGDVVIALNTLRENLREVLNRGWRFNTDFEWRIAFDGANKFPVPTNLLKFKVSERTDQVGPVPTKEDDGTYATVPTRLDIVIRGGFFYNRLLNKADFGDATDRPQIFIDTVWTEDFENCPETVRKFVTVRATRQFVTRVVGGREISADLAEDQRAAWLNLLRDQGNDKRRTIFDNYGIMRALGRRPRRVER